jgi:hypothetical protein
VHALTMTLAETQTPTDERLDSLVFPPRQPPAAAFLAPIRRLREWVSARTAEERTRMRAGHHPPSTRSG